MRGSYGPIGKSSCIIYTWTIFYSYVKEYDIIFVAAHGILPNLTQPQIRMFSTSEACFRAERLASLWWPGCSPIIIHVQSWYNEY